MSLKRARSVSFDTSFLLKDSECIDKVVKMLRKDNIPCFVTATVMSEMEHLKVFGRIDEAKFHKATQRWKKADAKVIDFKNRLVASAINRTCVDDMEQQHGTSTEHIINDCSIITQALKNGVDFFLSEDFHFTSALTEAVIVDMEHNACKEYHMMCDEEMYAADCLTFLKAYNNGNVDTDILLKEHLDVRKPGKTL